MSIKLMSEVLEQAPYNGTSLLIHLILANHANEEGICWPSVTTIARQARCSESTVHRMLTKLGEDGLLERSERPGKSNLFRLLPLSPMTPPPVIAVTPHPCHSYDTQNHKEPSENLLDASRRDLIFEALVEVVGLPDDRMMTKDERGRFNAAVKQLKDIETTPDEIRKRAREYRRIYANVKLTPQALTGNWSQLAVTTPVTRQEYAPDSFVPEPTQTAEQREAGLAAIRGIVERFRVKSDA